MRELLSSVIIPLGMIALGALAITLPYRYNPFRLKDTFVRGLSEDACRKVPKGIGWMLVGMGSLALLGLGVFTGAAMLADAKDRQRQLSTEEVILDNQKREKALVAQILAGVRTADHYDLNIRHPVTGKGRTVVASGSGSTLAMLKDIFDEDLISVRDNLNSVLYLKPNATLDFKSGERVILRISFSIKIDALNANANDNDGVYQKRLPAEVTALILQALPQLTPDLL